MFDPTNNEDWWSFAGLYDELEKAGFSHDECWSIFEDLSQLFQHSADLNGWEPISGEFMFRCNLWGRELYWDYFVNGVPSWPERDHEREHFISCAVNGNLDLLIDAWLAGVPVEHIVS